MRQSARRGDVCSVLAQCSLRAKAQAAPWLQADGTLSYTGGEGAEGGGGRVTRQVGAGRQARTRACHREVLPLIPWW